MADGTSNKFHQFGKFCWPYGTVVGFDMNILEARSDAEIIAAIADYVNRLADAVNSNILTMNELMKAVEEMEAQWANVKDAFAPQIGAAVDAYLSSGAFLAQVQEMISEQLADSPEFKQLSDSVDALAVKVTPTDPIKFMDDGLVSYEDGVYQKVVNPNPCVAATSGAIMQPLPFLQVSSTYRSNRSNFIYGNDYTGMNVNAAGTDWELASIHKDSNGKMAIDCATLCLLTSMGIQYAMSSYAGVKNTAYSNYINMFDANTIRYMNYEMWNLGGDEVEIEHKRLLANEWAKLLYDNGLLQKIPYQVIPRLYNNVQIGDVLFWSHESQDPNNVKFGHIYHCATVVFKCVDAGTSGSETIVVQESNENGQAVHYSLINMARRDYPAIKYKFTPPPYMYPIQNYPLGEVYDYEDVQPASDLTFNFSIPGYAVIKSGGVSNVHTVSMTNTDGEVTLPDWRFTLNSRQQKLIVVPAGFQMTVTHSNVSSMRVVAGGQYIGAVI